MKKACDGLVLRVTDSGENDRTLTFLTAEEGKLHIIAKGARSVRSRNASLCRILSYSNLELHKKNDLYWLMGGSLNNAFFGINGDLEAFSLASYIAEIADEISGESFPAHEVLQMTLNTLYAIENGLKPLWQIKATYELFAANISGFMPDLVTCRDCGKESFEGELWLDVMNGAIVCPECLSKKNGSLPVPEGMGYAGVMLDCIEGMQSEEGRPLVLSVLNQGSIPFLSDDDVVEVTCNVSKNGIQPVKQETVPTMCELYIRLIKRYERLAVEAVREGSEEKAIEALKLEGDEKVGASIICRAIEAPLRKLVNNAGQEAALVIANVKKSTGTNGYNVRTGEYCDLLKAGVVDPAKVTRSALQNAASIAGLLLTTDCMVTDLPEKKDACNCAGHGGAPDMGGMM